MVSGITNATGRRLPAFRLAFYDPLTGPSLTRQSSHIDLSPDLEQLTFTKQIDGGDCAMSAGYDELVKFVSGEERHFRSLSQNVEVKDFAHVRLTEGKRAVWGGRVLLPEYPRGRFAAFQAKGYMYTATNDNPYLPGFNNTQQANSGVILRQALQSCCPMLTPNEARWSDPSVPHPYNAFHMQYPSQIVQQMLTDGDYLGNQIGLVSSEHNDRKVSLFSQTGTGRPTYIVSMEDAVSWQRNLEGIYGAVYYNYSGGANPPINNGNGTGAIYVECQQSLKTWADQHGGLSRIAQVSGGTMSDAVALAKAQTWIAINSVVAVAGTITVGGTYFGDVQGLRLAGGGTRAPWLVEPGQTVQVADQGIYYIVQTSFNGNTCELTVSLGSLRFGQDRMLRGLRTSAGHVAAQTSPVSGAPV
jgi:hypothetical protein